MKSCDFSPSKSLTIFINHGIQKVETSTFKLPVQNSCRHRLGKYFCLQCWFNLMLYNIFSYNKTTAFNR